MTSFNVPGPFLTLHTRYKLEEGPTVPNLCSWEFRAPSCFRLGPSPGLWDAHVPWPTATGPNKLLMEQGSRRNMEPERLPSSSEDYKLT